MWSRDFLLLVNSSPKTGWSQSLGSIHKGRQETWDSLQTQLFTQAPVEKPLSGLRRLHAFSPTLLSIQRPMHRPPSNVHETQEPRTHWSQAPPLPRMDAPTGRLALMPPKWSMPIPIPKDNNIRRSSRSCCTVMHSQQRHVQSPQHICSWSSHAHQPIRRTLW